MNRNTTKLKRVHSKNNETQSPAKRKFRNENEKRRRDLFTQLITNLKDLLSIEKTSSSNEETHGLDKASVLCQAAPYLQKHHQSLTTEAKLALSNLKSTSTSSNNTIDFSWKPSCDIVTSEEWLQTTIESMHCFFLIIKADLYHSKIIYVSGNINSYLGYAQDELIDHSLFQFILPSDHDRLLPYLLNNHQVLETCDVSWKRANSNDYEQCSIIGAFRNINENGKYLMSIVKINTLDRTLIMNIEDSPEEFVTHLNLQARFIFIDSKTGQFLGYSSCELIGHTFFDFVHPDDLGIISRAHQIWKDMGNGKSDPYRFLTKGQQWIFLQTSSQVHINSWTGKAESYICTTTVLQCNSLQQQLPGGSNTVQSEYSNEKRMSFTDMDTEFEFNQIDFFLNSVESSSLSPTTTVAISSPSNLQEKNGPSSENEITSFLFHLRNDKYRENIFEKLIQHRKKKQDEIRVCQEEIQVIDDILQFISQYQIKHSPEQTKNPPIEDIPINVFDTNCDLNLFNSPLVGVIDDFSLQTSSEDDPIIDGLASLFSPSSTPFNFSSPMTPFSNLSSNNDLIQEINYLSAITNSPN